MSTNLHLYYYRQLLFSFTIIIALIPLAGCEGQKSEKSGEYTYKEGDPNGIGKWYMGREIAHVMGFQGIDWLERKSREKEENTSALIGNMNIQKDDVIADIGAGSGYHVFKMATLAQEGKVYGVDLQKEMLAAMEKRIKKDKFTNVELVQGSTKDINLPENILDKVLMVDVYHEFEFPIEMISSVKKSMKDDGELYLIEYRGEDPTVPIKKVHKMTETQAVKEMQAAGFVLQENPANLPWQHCMIFVKKEK